MIAEKKESKFAALQVHCPITQVLNIISAK